MTKIDAHALSIGLIDMDTKPWATGIRLSVNMKNYNDILPLFLAKSVSHGLCNHPFFYALV